MFRLTMKKLQILMALYKAKEGTILKICRDCGIPNERNTVYRMKAHLLRCGILENLEIFEYKDYFNTRFYRVHHNEIDRFLMTTWLSPLYERLWEGKVLTIRKLLPKEEYYA
jgi:DNA-binding IclR family transcriptional regulator